MIFPFGAKFTAETYIGGKLFLFVISYTYSRAFPDAKVLSISLRHVTMERQGKQLLYEHIYAAPPHIMNVVNRVTEHITTILLKMGLSRHWVQDAFEIADALVRENENVFINPEEKTGS